MGLPFPTEDVGEGLVTVTVPKLATFAKKPWKYAPSKAPVFYNPIMEFNRDVAVVALRAYQKMRGEELSVCEPLAACGIRGIRFVTEVDGIKSVVLNDLNPEAALLCQYNAEKNKMTDKVWVENVDANTLLSLHSTPGKRFDAIDVDPFGSPAPFIDSAVRSLRNGGFIALTATDMAPLCGVHREASIRKYGGKSLRTEYCHELAVRLLVGCLVLSATKHDMGTRVLFSHSTDHYIRVYAIIRHGAEPANVSVRIMGHILHCFKCFHREIIPEIGAFLKHQCDECGEKLEAAGPLWLGRLFDKDFSLKMLEEVKKTRLGKKRGLIRLLNTILMEVEGPPTYYVIDRMCDKFGLPIPPKASVIKELQRRGFIATPTHFKSRGIRTDAPAKTVKEVLLQNTRTQGP